MLSLLCQSYSQFILYVVDNASSDGTLRRVSEYQDPRIVIVPNLTNLGIAEGNNVGIRAALKDGCESVLLINNDTVFDETLLAGLERALSHRQAQMVAPKILYFNDPGKIWAAGGYFSLLWGSSRHFGIGRPDNGQFDEPRFVKFSPACCLLIRKEVFQRIGMMDPAYFCYFDDTDFCYRAYRGGMRLFYIPSARILHKVSSLTGGRESEFSIQYCCRNEVYYLLKSVPSWQLIFYLPIIQLRILCRQFMSSRTLRTFWMIERSLWSGIAHFRMHRPKKEQTQQHREDVCVSSAQGTDVQGARS
jgi:hypothetical protein